MRPRYMTATRSHSDQARPMSCVIRSSAEPARAPQAEQQVQHLRAHRDVERRDGLVADDRPPARARARSRSRRAGAARPRARADSGARSAPRARGPASSSAVAARSTRSPRAMPCMRSGSCTSSLTRMRGLSDWYGSWNTICTLRAQRARAAAVERRALEAQLTGARLLEAEQRARRASSCRSRTRRRRRAPRSGATRGRRRRARARRAPRRRNVTSSRAPRPAA